MTIGKIKFCNVFSVFSTCILLVLLFSSEVYAQCDLASGTSNDNDYSNADCYGNEDFYRLSDAGKLDWNQVNFDKLNFDDARVYQTEGFYKKLSSMDENSKDFYYKKIDYGQADLSLLDQHLININKFQSDVIPDKILNFNSIDADTDYKEDFYRNKGGLNCEECKLEFIRNKDGSYTIKSDAGSEITITKYPKGTMFELEPYGAILVRYPKEIKQIEVPIQDNVLVEIKKDQTIK